MFLVTRAADGATGPWGHGARHLCCAVAVALVARLLAEEQGPLAVRASSRMVSAPMPGCG